MPELGPIGGMLGSAAGGMLGGMVDGNSNSNKNQSQDVSKELLKVLQELVEVLKGNKNSGGLDPVTGAFKATLGAAGKMLQTADLGAIMRMGGTG